jgi:hypothetical protein
MSFSAFRPFLRSGILLQTRGNAGMKARQRAGASGSASGIQVQAAAQPKLQIWLQRALLPATGAAAVLLGSLMYSLNEAKSSMKGGEAKEEQLDATSSSWAAELVSGKDLVKVGSKKKEYETLSVQTIHPFHLHLPIQVMSTEEFLASEHPFFDDDHMFSAFVTQGIIRDMNGYFRKESNEFTSVIALGRDVAGFPRIVHGGLTAAIFDEAFGALLFCLKNSGQVKFWCVRRCSDFFVPFSPLQRVVNYQHHVNLCITNPTGARPTQSTWTSTTNRILKRAL